MLLPHPHWCRALLLTKINGNRSLEGLWLLLQVLDDSKNVCPYLHSPIFTTSWTTWLNCRHRLFLTEIISMEPYSVVTCLGYFKLPCHLILLAVIHAVSTSHILILLAVIHAVSTSHILIVTTGTGMCDSNDTYTHICLLPPHVCPDNCHTYLPWCQVDRYTHHSCHSWPLMTPPCYSHMVNTFLLMTRDRHSNLLHNCHKISNYNFNWISIYMYHKALCGTFRFISWGSILNILL